MLEFIAKFESNITLNLNQTLVEMLNCILKIVWNESQETLFKLMVTDRYYHPFLLIMFKVNGYLHL